MLAIRRASVKGTIVKCLEGLVKSKGGREAWQAVLTRAGMPENSLFMVAGVVPDADVMKLIAGTADVLKVSTQQAMDAFGEHWASVYAPQLYGVYYARASNAREFLLHMNDVHLSMTKMAEASPPRFAFEETGPDQLVMTYSSPRGLAALMPSLVKGVAVHYKERVQTRLVGNALHITFNR
jgi:Haem-NO-binding